MIWTKEQASENHFHSEILAEYLTKILNPEKGTVDFGCGTGFYVDYLIERGFKAIGIEGTKVDNKDYILQSDLSKPFDLAQKLKKERPAYEFEYSQVISIEVGEHISKAFESVFLDNLTTKNVEKVVLSWATPFQGGLGHVNERPITYIFRQMKKRGFHKNIAESVKLRNLLQKDRLCWWLKNTIMIYERSK